MRLALSKELLNTSLMPRLSAAGQGKIGRPRGGWMLEAPHREMHEPAVRAASCTNQTECVCAVCSLNASASLHLSRPRTRHRLDLTAHLERVCL